MTVRKEPEKKINVLQFASEEVDLIMRSRDLVGDGVIGALTGSALGGKSHVRIRTKHLNGLRRLLRREIPLSTD